MTLLAEYDPKLRELRGVYYTPEPAVSYIVRSVDYILSTDFLLGDGLADISTALAEHPSSQQPTIKVPITENNVYKSNTSKSIKRF